MRTRDYITTYSGHAFSPLAPDADAIDLRDVAHALARIGRANGHFADFYSVGQHCLDCAQEALARGYSARQALACLLHDASEAYMADITSPVKKNLRQYVAVEDHLLDVIYQKYLPGGIRPREQRVVKRSITPCCTTNLYILWAKSWPMKNRCCTVSRVSALPASGRWKSSIYSF